LLQELVTQRGAEYLPVRGRPTLRGWYLIRMGSPSSSLEFAFVRLILRHYSVSSTVMLASEFAYSFQRVRIFTPSPITEVTNEHGNYKL